MLIIFILLIFISSLSTTYFCDRINRFQYENYRKEWNKDGEPSGFFWNAPESKIFTGNIKRTRRIWSLIFGNDDWMKNHSNIRRTALFMRLCAFATFLTIGVFAYLSISNKI